MLQDRSIDLYATISLRDSLSAAGDVSGLVANFALVPAEVICLDFDDVGETLAEREANQTESVVGRQLQAVIDTLGDDIARVVVAYEPVWAIGTGRAATPELAQDVHQAIRRTLARLAGPEKAMQIRILYGGSVKPDNAAALFAMPDVDGALVGGASLVVNDFLAICSAVAGDEVK